MVFLLSKKQKKLCDDLGVDVYNIVKEIQPICLRMLAGLTSLVLQSQSKKATRAHMK